MTNLKTTKRALFSSAIALLLCFSMLLGTTFAWFTDSVTSNGNIIQTGTLEVFMYWAEGNEAVPAEANGWKNASEGAIFNNKKWEPGYVEAKHLKVANEGTLALMYQLAIIPTGEVSELADVIDVYLYDIADTDANATQVADRFDIDETMYVGTLADVINNGIVQGDLAAGNEYTTTIVLKMQVTADNDYQDLSIGDDFTIQLLATQYTAENDSFDNTYDKDAWMPGMVAYNEADLRAAFANGGNVKLAADVDLAEYVTVSEGTKVVVDLNGHTLSATSGNVIRNSGELTIVNGVLSGTTTYTINNQSVNGVVHVKDVKSINGGFYNAGTMKVENSIIENTASNKHALINNGDATTNLVVNGGTYSTTSTNAIVCSYSGTIVINGGDFTQIGSSFMLDGLGLTINGGTFNDDDGKWAIRGTNHTINGGIFNFDPSKYVGEGFKTVQNGDTYYVVPENVVGVIATADDLVALGGTKINGTYMLMADLDMSGKAMKSMEVSGGATVNFIGNGHSISNLNLTAANLHGMTGAGFEVAGLFDLSAPATTVSLTVSDLVMKDATVTSSGYAAAIVGYNPNGGTVITLNNVDVAGAIVTAETVAALVGYTTGPLNMTDCDVSGLALTGEAGRPDKVGALVGTANTATCTVTATNCTNETSYPDFGRVIGDATWNGAVVVSASTQEDLNSAVSGNAIVTLSDGTYTMPSVTNKDVTISGTKETVIDVKATNCGGSNVTLNGVTVKGNGTYTGIQHVDTVTYNNVTVEGEMCLYGNKVVFNSCTFNLAAEQYIWTYGATVVEFNNCTFNSQGKALLVYGDSPKDLSTTCTTYINNCKFNAETAVEGKAAIEIDSRFINQIVYIDNLTTAEGFDEGSISGNDLWNNKKGNAAKVYVDNVEQTLNEAPNA